MGWKIGLRKDEHCHGDTYLSPDLVVVAGYDRPYLDFALAEPSESRNRGGLRSRSALHTAILIQLFTDARMADDDPLLDPLDPDRRGWWGDSVARAPEQGDHATGSRLWTIRRDPLTRDTEQKARDIVIEALQPILDQGAVARFDVQTSAGYDRLGYQAPETGVLGIKIDGYAQDGSRIYEQRFDVLWDQIRNGG